MTTDDIGKANAINRFFAQVGETLAASIPDTPYDSEFVHLPPVFEFHKIEVNEIMNIIRDMKPSNSASSDGLTARLVKAAGPGIFLPLVHVINLSLISSSFASCWKLGCVTPLFKEGNASDPSNYRPITILPTVGKICERVAHTQLYKYCTDYNIISDCQSGFRKGHSTTSCLLDFLDNIFVQVDRGAASGVLFLDLRKAFDTVNHTLLLQKLRSYGVRSKPLAWFESYLEGRTQVTKVGQALSDRLPITCGVPQGSILGPLLFSLFINDLHLNVPNYVKTNLYADDTALTVSSNSREHLEQMLNETLQFVSSWFQTNKLSLNFKKSNVMIFSTPQSSKKFNNIIVKHEEVCLDIKSKTKYLGVVLDSYLNFHEHVEYIKSKTIGKLKLLGRVRGTINKSTAELLYTSLILPLFDYADVVYHCLNQRDTNTLQRLQNMGIKTILQAEKQTSTALIHELTNIPYLVDKRDIDTAAEMFKVNKGLAPPKINEMFTKIENVSGANTRQSTRGDFVIPAVRLETGKRNFRYRGPKTWSLVPVEIRSCSNTKSFKKNLRRAWTGQFPNSIT